MANHQLGAHEVLELHEVLCHSINVLNLFHLYEPHIRDQELKRIIMHQTNFMTKEYNQLVNITNVHSGNVENIEQEDSTLNFEPRYGLDQPIQSYPKPFLRQLMDSDIASGMLNLHKTLAEKKFTSSLECADLSLREGLLQGAKNCADQAYEIFQYMNVRGYYQVPKLVNQDDVLNQYQEAPDPNLFHNGLQS